MKSFWVVLAARLVQMATAFVALRIMTELLGPTELGRFAILISITTFFALIFINPAGMYVNRRLHVWNESATLGRHLKNYGLFVIVIAALAAVSVPTVQLLFDTGWPMEAAWLSALVAGSVLLTTYNQTLIPALNLLEHRKAWLVFSTLSLWAALGFSAFFAMREPTAESWQMGQLLGFAIGAVVATPFFIKSLNRKPSGEDEVEAPRKILSFTLPLAISVALYWGQFQSYRLFVGQWISLETLGGFMGVYTLIAGLMAAFENLLQQYLYPRLYAEGASTDPLVQAAAWRRYAILAIPMTMMAGWTLLSTFPALVSLFLASKFHAFTSFAIAAVVVEVFRVIGSVYGMAGQIAYRTKALLIPQLVGFVSLLLLIPYFFGTPGIWLDLAFVLALGIPGLLFVLSSMVVTRFKLGMRLPRRVYLPPLLATALTPVFYFNSGWFGSGVSGSITHLLTAGGTFAVVSLWVIYNWRRYQRPSETELRVVHIMRAPFGGIRLHVLSLMDESSLRQWLVTDVSEEDSVFKAMRRAPSFASKVIDLSIKEAPGFSDVVNLVKLYFRLRKIRPHVIHGHGAKGGLYARILADPLFAKAVYSAHGGSLHRAFSPAKERLYHLVEKILAGKTDAVVFESQYSRDRYEESIRKLAGRAHLVHNGLDLPARLTRQEKASGPFVIGAFGQLRPMKGQDLLIEATPLLLASGLDVEIRIYGDGPARKDFEDLISKHGLQSRVRLMGDVSDPVERMKECDLIVQPSRFESFGYSAVEAMALGVPLVASAVGGLNEIVTDGVDGLLVRDLEPRSFAKRIEEALRNPTLRAKLVEAARKSVEAKFDAARMKRDVASIYRRTCTI